MDLKIIIGDDELEIPASQVVAITKQAAKVGDFSKVLADGTNMITVAQTARNKAIMQNAHIMQNNSGLPYTRMTAKLIQEGIETIQDGFAILESVNGNYQLQLIGGNASFFFLIKDKNVRDLDLKVFDHFWTNANAAGSQGNSDGYIYAIFEQSEADQTPAQNTTSDPDAVNTALLLPSFFAKTIVEAIFLEAGFDFQSDILTTDEYKEMVVFAGSTPDRGKDVSYLNFVFTNTAMYSGIGAFEQMIFQGNGVFTEQESNYWTGPNPNVSFFMVSDNTTVSLAFSLIVTNNDVIPQNGLINIYYSTADGTGTLVIPFTAPVGTSTINLSAEFECVINPAGACGFDIETIFAAIVDVEADSTLTATFEFISNNPITTDPNFYFIRGITPVPDMSQADFLKDIIGKKFNIIFDTDVVNAVVTGKRFDEVRENIPQAIDLSDKFHDDDTTTEIRFAIPGYNQRNILKWKPDDISGYTGDAIVFCDNETLEYEKVVLEMSKFAASSTIERLSQQVPYVPLFKDGEASNNITDRVFMLNRVNVPAGINFTRGVDVINETDVAFAFFHIAGNTLSLDYETLTVKYYQTLISILQRSKLLTGMFKLTISDVYNYDPFLPVYIQKFNEYFYWEKLDNYVKNKKTKLTLIRL